MCLLDLLGELKSWFLNRGPGDTTLDQRHLRREVLTDDVHEFLLGIGSCPVGLVPDEQDPLALRDETVCTQERVDATGEKANGVETGDMNP